MLGMGDVTGMMGGGKVFSRPPRSEIALVEAAARGLPLAALEHTTTAARLSPQDVARLIAPPRTLARRKKTARLSPDESDRLMRVARSVAHAVRVFGVEDKAHHWLRRANPTLGGKRPLDLLISDAGARAVETVLGRIEHGVYS